MRLRWLLFPLVLTGAFFFLGHTSNANFELRVNETAPETFVVK
jgi:hypothetical protein